MKVPANSLIHFKSLSKPSSNFHHVASKIKIRTAYCHTKKIHVYIEALTIHYFSLKVVNNTRTERRKTIGGIDFEKLASSQAGEYDTISSFPTYYPVKLESE